MSIDLLTEMPLLRKEYNVISNKVKKILGYYALNSNHYYHTILHNELIDINTSEEKIIEIHNKYLELIKNLESYFKKYNILLNKKCFPVDGMSGNLYFLGMEIEVYKGFEKFIPILTQFETLFYRVKVLADKYGGLDASSLDFSAYNGYGFYEGPLMLDLFGITITANYTDDIINNILLINYKKK